jgi:hypothetical protein
MIFILLISYFFLSSLVKVLFVFIFIIQSKFIVYYFYQFGLYSFKKILLKLFFFPISTFKQKLIFIF